MLGMAACSGSGQARSDADHATVDAEPINLADYEVFDASSYEDEPARIETNVNHDVPIALMESRADAGIVQIVKGYRVQVFMSLDRDEAVTAEEEVRAWWESLTEEERLEKELPEDLAVYNLFRQPYYRVRAGDFLQRAEAERLMLLLFRRFAGASVVPDQVTIRR